MRPRLFKNDIFSGVVSDMMLCLKTVGTVDALVLRLLPGLVPIGLKVVEKYWDKDLLRNQAISMLLTIVQGHSSGPHRDLLLDLNGVSVISR
jgi:hypothetical protein